MVGTLRVRVLAKAWLTPATAATAGTYQHITH